MKVVRPGGIHVLKSYKIHEEQIANIARDFKERNQTRRPDSLLPRRSGMGDIQETNGKTDTPLRGRIRKIVWETGPLYGPLAGCPTDLVPRMETPGCSVTAIRCFRCGVTFPVADFYYTQKSGLCIDCWEEIVV
jgi:hypothetical protein